MRRLQLWFSRLVHREPVPEVFDIFTRTEREMRLEEIEGRKRRYLRTILPAMGLVLFGFFVTGAPTLVRVGALVVAALLVPFAVAATVPKRW